MPPADLPANRKVLHRIGGNIAWLLADKVLRLGLTLIVTVFVARYLGPEQFGVLNFVLALVAVFAVVAAFGLQGTVVRDLVQSPADTGKILAGALVIKLSAAVLMYGLLLATIWILRPSGDASRVFVALMGTTLIFRCSEAYKYWFESQIRSKYVVWAENIVFAMVVCAKLAMVYLQAPLMAFVWLATIESLCTALFLRLLFKKIFVISPDWHFCPETTKRLILQSWPLVISAAAWILYVRIDQIMLAQLAGDKDVGIYSAAVRLSEVSNFIPGIIAFSVMPAILPLLQQDPRHYQRRLQQLFDVSVLLMLCFALVVTLLAHWIIPLLFGVVYQGAAEVLVIHVWCGIFSALAVVSSRHLINIGLQTVLMQRNLLGLLLNVPLNFWLIPRYGAVGAASASLASMICVNYIFDIFHPATRVMFGQKTKALLLIQLPSNMKEFYKLVSKGMNS